MPRIFLSYSSEDKFIVTRLAEDLQKVGVDVWFAEWELQVGDDIPQRLDEALTTCEIFAVVWSSNSANSKWVRRELSAAVAQADDSARRLLPLKISDAEMPPLIAGRKYADFTVSYETGLSELLHALNVVDCQDRSVEGASTRTLVARRGRTIGNAQRIIYASYGIDKFMLHWLLESIGDDEASIAATQYGHALIMQMLEALFVRKFGLDELEKLGATWLLSTLFQAVNVGTKELALQSSEPLGSRAVIALENQSRFICGSAGPCGGLAAHEVTEGLALHVIDPGFATNAKGIPPEKFGVYGVAPLGFSEPDELKPKFVSCKFRTVADFVALTSFQVRSTQITSQLAKRVLGSDRSVIARTIFESCAKSTSDGLCVVLQPSSARTENDALTF
jgi:hypothetical protein